MRIQFPASVSPRITRSLPSAVPTQGLKFMFLVLHEGFMGPATARLSGQQRPQFCTVSILMDTNSLVMQAQVLQYFSKSYLQPS